MVAAKKKISVPPKVAIKLPTASKTTARKRQLIATEVFLIDLPKLIAAKNMVSNAQIADEKKFHLDEPAEVFPRKKRLPNLVAEKEKPVSTRQKCTRNTQMSAKKLVSKPPAVVSQPVAKNPTAKKPKSLQENTVKGKVDEVNKPATMKRKAPTQLLKKTTPVKKIAAKKLVVKKTVHANATSESVFLIDLPKLIAAKEAASAAVAKTTKGRKIAAASAITLMKVRTYGCSFVNQSFHSSVYYI